MGLAYLGSYLQNRFIDEPAVERQMKEIKQQIPLRVEAQRDLIAKIRSTFPDKPLYVLIRIDQYVITDSVSGLHGAPVVQLGLVLVTPQYVEPKTVRDTSTYPGWTTAFETHTYSEPLNIEYSE